MGKHRLKLEAERGGAYLEISQLRELLSTSLELAAVWLDLLMHYPVGTHVAPLGKTLAAAFT